MKAKIELKDIGPFKDEKFHLESGYINVVEMPNAMGKSTLLKALALLQSLPISSKLVEESALRLGLWSDEPPQPLVRIGAKEGKIAVTLNGDIRECRIKVDGDLFISKEGDERFLLTSLITSESDLVRRIFSGEEDLRWLLPSVSLVARYENIFNITSKILDQIQRELEEARDKKSKLEKLQKAIDSLKLNLEDTRSKIAKVKEEIGRELTRTDPKAREDYDKLSREINSLEESINAKKWEKDNIKSSLDESNKNLKEVEREIDNLQEKIEEFKNKLSKLGSEREVKKLIDDIEKKEMPKLSDDKKFLDGQLDLLRKAIKSVNIYQECPVCGSKLLDVDLIEQKIKDIQEKVWSVDRKIRDIVNRRNILIDRLSQITKLGEEIGKLRIKLGPLDSQRIRLIAEMDSRKTRLKSLELEIEEVSHKLSYTRNLFEEIRSKLEHASERIRELHEELGRLEEVEKSIVNKIEDSNKQLAELNKGSVLGIELEMEKVLKVASMLEKSLEKTLDHIKARIEEQKVGFADRFNQSVMDLIDKMGFEMKVSVDSSELKVRVERGGKYQRLSSLSASEKAFLATVLQIAIKEAFLPEIPFLLIDEVTLNFDKEKVAKIVEYLLRLAIERDWIIVLTKLGEERAVKSVSRVAEIAF